MGKVKFSSGNSKMGHIPSVSLPAIKTCIECDCNSRCYGMRIERRYPNVAKAYQSNLNVLLNDPQTYWREVEAKIMLSRFFRFHVSGDIPDMSYLLNMIRIAHRNPHCEILCFTKKYEYVNIVRKESLLPNNLHIIFSGWVGLEMVNPFSFPEAHVRYKNGTTTANNSALTCQGNCSYCALTSEGCWTLREGEQVVFNEH